MTWLLNMIVGLVTGILSGFGIGGGSLLILYLTCIENTPQFSAAGINLLYFLFCAPAALVSHIKNRLIDKKAAIICTAAGIPSSVAAALAASYINTDLLRRIFGVFLIYIGIKELFFKTPSTKAQDS